MQLLWEVICNWYIVSIILDRYNVFAILTCSAHSGRMENGLHTEALTFKPAEHFNWLIKYKFLSDTIKGGQIYRIWKKMAN